MNEKKPGPSTELGNLAFKLQEMRHQRGHTLEKLAGLSGVSVGLLSQLERGKGNPSFLTLSKIAYGLGFPISQFFEGTIVESNPVVRKNQRRKLDLSDQNLVYELLTPDLNRLIEFVWVEMPPGLTTEAHPFCHEGEECGLVLEGMLEVHWGDKTYLLEEGDSISYACNEPHWYRNPGNEPAISVWAVTPPSF